MWSNTNIEKIHNLFKSIVLFYISFWHWTRLIPRPRRGLKLTPRSKPRPRRTPKPHHTSPHHTTPHHTTPHHTSPHHTTPHHTTPHHTTVHHKEAENICAHASTQEYVPYNGPMDTMWKSGNKWCCGCHTKMCQVLNFSTSPHPIIQTCKYKLPNSLHDIIHIFYLHLRNHKMWAKRKYIIMNNHTHIYGADWARAKILTGSCCWDHPGVANRIFCEWWQNNERFMAGPRAEYKSYATCNESETKKTSNQFPGRHFSTNMFSLCLDKEAQWMLFKNRGRAHGVKRIVIRVFLFSLLVCPSAPPACVFQVLLFIFGTHWFFENNRT